MRVVLQNKLFVLGCCLIALGGIGCKKNFLNNNQQVDHIDLMTQPVAANLDGVPGPDGFQIKVYLYHEDQTILGKGTLEILMFDGSVPPRDLSLTSPSKTWTFTPSELKPFLATSYGLMHYQLALPWGNEKPSSKTATILARYKERNGKETVSLPVVVPIKLE